MQETNTPEHVLVIPRSEYINHEPFSGFRPLRGLSDLGDYLCGVNPVASFMDREAAETDENFKQLISYCIILCGDSILTYRRSGTGGEDRLHGQLSIGVGGHANNQDDPEEFFWAYANSVIRELHEEIGLKIDHDALQASVAGLINDDTDPVGRVHLGVCHIVSVNEKQAANILTNCEHTLLEPQFVPLPEFHEESLHGQLESWSRHAMDHLLMEHGASGKWCDTDFQERIGLLAICAANLASAAGGFRMQDNHRGHRLSAALVCEAAGAVQCMLQGLTHNGDVGPDEVKDAAKKFYGQLPSILKHQKIQNNE